MSTKPKSSFPRKAKILVVDDHPMVRERMMEIIRRERDMEVCGEAADVSQTLAAVAKLHPDVVLLDLNLRGVLGLDLIKDISARFPSLPMLVVSMYDEVVFAERVLRAGAKGYISKEEPTKVVVGAIRRVLANETYLSERMAARLARAYVHGKDKSIQSSFEQLTDRELEILEMIGEGLTTRRIAETLHIDIRTVESYRARIKEKLHLQTGTELLMRAIEWSQHVGAT